MNPWTNRPDARDTTPTMQILRARPATTTAGVLLSPDLTGAYTHYWRGRTRICENPNCDPCNAHHKPRWYGYAALWSPNSNAVALLELTPACLPQIDAHIQRHNTLRLAQIRLRRANNKPNSRLILQIDLHPYPSGNAPPNPDVHATLERLWECTIVHPALEISRLALNNGSDR